MSRLFASGLHLPQRRKTVTSTPLIAIASRQSSPRCLWAALVLVFVFMNATSIVSRHARGDEPAGKDATAEKDASGAIHIGMGGIYRPGYWTAIRWVDSGGTAAEIATAETLDSDGVRVRYRQSPGETRDTTGEASGFAYAVPGSASAPLTLYGGERLVETATAEVAGAIDNAAVVGAIDNATTPTIYRGRFPSTAIDPATPWIVAIGDTLGLERIGLNELLGRDSAVALAKIGSAAELPDHTAGWEGVDFLVVNPPGQSVLRSLSSDQVAAILGWVHGGGRLFLSLGAEGGELLAGSPWLGELAAISPASASIRIDPAGVETFASSQTPLKPLEGLSLAETGGRTLMSGRNVARQPIRLASQRLVGLGRVTVTSFALHSGEIATWPDRTAIVTRLHPGLLDGQADRRRDARTVSTVAYDDLAGQIRGALDRFDSHRRLSFSIVSLILLLLAALVGPLDYWLVNRVFGKPLLGWVSFPVSVVSVAALVVGLNGLRMTGGSAATGGSEAAGGSAATDELLANRIEIVDIDATSGEPIGRVTSISHVSSRGATRSDLRLAAAPNWSGDDAMGGLPLTRPHGFPGPTFGGISIVGEDRSLPPYEIRLSRPGLSGPGLSGPGGASAGGQFSAGGDLASVPTGVPILPAGSKSWMTTWAFRPTLGETSGLVQRRGSELLAGGVTNPLGVDLLDGVLVYGNWAYLLPGRFRAGQTIVSIESLRQKNFRWHLSKREALENTSRLEAWDVGMHADLARLTEVLMFESSVGGRDYTGLYNRPLGGLDLTYVLGHGVAILYGRVAEPILQSGVAQERPSVSAVRVILPVAPPSQESP